MVKRHLPTEESKTFVLQPERERKEKITDLISVLSHLFVQKYCHTEWSQTEKEKYLRVIPYKNLKRHDADELIYKTQTDSQT